MENQFCFTVPLKCVHEAALSTCSFVPIESFGEHSQTAPSARRKVRSVGGQPDIGSL